ncbi:MAG: hypothetical protein HQ541_10005 [Mariniphaga sp.]|nr:hypothetical protein [Mariniphaga sp.]
MKKIVSILFIFISIAGYSQGFLTSKNIKVDLSGFVRNDFILDSRKNVDACDHLLELFPQRPVYDSNHEDINAQPSAHLLNIFTRFGTRFSGLEIGKAKVGAYVEVDFTGGSATNSLRFRHAYTQFTWEKTKILFGRTWHPTFIEKVYPSTLNENTGLPFQVFNRSPQIRLTYTPGENVDFIFGAVYQYKYANRGPSGKSYEYQRNAVIPNLHAQLQYYNNNWVMGVAVDWKTIQPRTSTTGTDGTFVTNEKLGTFAAIGYLKYSTDKFQFKAKSMYGQNVCESLLPSGYAVESINTSTGAETYTPMNHIYNWVNFTYGGAWKVGLFAGHLKNLGTSDAPIGPFYGFATDVDMMYKISPQLIYNYKNFMFGWEMSLTTAAYGDIDYSDKGKIINAENVTNFRNMISVAYKF